MLPAGSSILLGLSGGVDSVVLLHLLQQLSPRYSWRLSALHVHHGISPQAGAWAAFCTDLCARYGIPLQVEHVDIAPLRELGIEAAARKLRHAALARQQADFVALAHHLDDQVETLLLQLLRGAGVRGASAMPFIKRVAHNPPSHLKGEGWGEGDAPCRTALLRPLLGIARSELLAYAEQHALQWVEDESNADDAYPRNFLRHRILPLLEQRFPAYRATLARSARHFAEASNLLDQLAQQDAPGALHGDSLEVSRLRALDAVRGKNLLRFFIARQGAPMPESSRLEEMLRQLCHARGGAAARMVFGGWQAGCYQGKAYVFPAPPECSTEFCVQWRGEAALELPELGGTLYFESVAGQGLSREKLQQAAVTVRLRRGAERMRLDSKRHTRTLKNLFQEHGIPPWQRDNLPLLFCGDTLAAIPGIGVECGYQAAPGENGVAPRWERWR
ncbi:MAG: tRNA lysidine(34) synthetase TilS [Gallionellaceae bacterium]|nr:tRNA lysidine(34) synthetase TilS [Gallionellaceae bacterium]